MNANFTGVWNANLASSRFVGPRPASLKMKILHSDPELHQAMVITRDDGSVQRAEFRCRTDGTPSPSVMNGNPIEAHAKWQEEELLIETWIDSGPTKAHFCDWWRLAPDGRTLVMEHRNDALSGQRVVLEKAA